MTTLGELLLAQLPKFDGKRVRLAEAIDITPSRLTRAIKGDYALDVRNCLRLALAAEIPASEVLRAAGKGDIADLIERLYGPGTSLSPSARQVVDLWEAARDREIRTVVLFILQKAAPPTVRTSEGSSSTSATPRGTKPAARRGRRRSAE